MKSARLPFLLVAAALLTAPAARAQFVQLSRCQSAYPCNAPIGLIYKPEPLIAGAYGNVPASAGAFAFKVDPSRLHTPVLELSKTIEKQDFASDAARLFVLKYPSKKKMFTLPPDPTAAEPAAEPARN